MSIRLAARFRSVALTTDAVWLGAFDTIEVRDLSGELLGRRRTQADVLLPVRDGRSVLCAGFATGDQSPDTIRVERWELTDSVEVTRGRVREDTWQYGDWLSPAEHRERALREVFTQTSLFATWAWQPGLVDVSDDGERVAVYVDTPDRRVQVWQAAVSDAALQSIALKDRNPIDLAILAGGLECAILETVGSQQRYRLSVWRISDGACLMECDVPKASDLCRSLSPQSVGLGFEREVCLLNTRNGSIESRVGLETGPVRELRVDPLSGRFIGLTDTQCVMIDGSTMKVSGTLKHGGLRGVDCDIRGDRVAALVTDGSGDEHPLLVLWHLDNAA